MARGILLHALIVKCFFFLARIQNEVNKIYFLIFKFDSAVFGKFDEFIIKFYGQSDTFSAEELTANGFKIHKFPGRGSSGK